MTSTKKTGAEIVADMMSREPLTSRERQMKVATQYAVQFGTDRPTESQARALVAASAAQIKAAGKW